jgi:hypothetical protein
VTFLQTLTDGFTTPYPNSRVMSSLNPAPEPLPPCAPEICEVEPLPGSKFYSIGESAGRQRKADEPARRGRMGVPREAADGLLRDPVAPTRRFGQARREPAKSGTAGVTVRGEMQRSRQQRLWMKSQLGECPFLTPS